MTIEQPETLTELFRLGMEKLKTKGIDGQMPSTSNYLASAKANQRLLDSILMKPSWLKPVAPAISLDLFGVKMKVPAFCSAMGKPPFCLTKK